MERLGIVGTFFTIKVYVPETHSQHHSKWRKAQIILTKMRNKTRVSPFLPLLNIVIKVFSRAMRQKEDIDWIQIVKEIKNIYFFESDIILNIRGPNDSTRNYITNCN